MIPHLPWWAAWPLGLTTIALPVSLFVTSRRRSWSATGALRALLLVWIAVSVVCVVLVAIDDFHQGDLELLAVVLVILTALWIADRGLSTLLRTH